MDPKPDSAPFASFDVINAPMESPIFVLHGQEIDHLCGASITPNPETLLHQPNKPCQFEPDMPTHTIW